jgi:hypothetical protein
MKVVAGSLEVRDMVSSGWQMLLGEEGIGAVGKPRLSYEARDGRSGLVILRSAAQRPHHALNLLLYCT